MNFRKRALIIVCLVWLSTRVTLAEEGSFVFSKEPIDPANPQKPTTHFSTGDHIYGLIQLPQPWRELGKVDGNKLILAVYTTVDSKRLGAYMELRSDEHLHAKHLLFDIAPAPDKMTNITMQEKMVALLKNAGWSDVLKLHIVDKDWWLDRVAGGNTMIQSRHMAAAAAYRDADGKHYYKTCTFHEHRLLTGGFGTLELTHQSQPVPISAKALGIEEKADTGPDMSAVAQDAMPDFSKPEEVLADIERMRAAAMKKRVFLLVGKCGTAANKIKDAVVKDPQGYPPEVQRIWLTIYEEFKKIP